MQQYGEQYEIVDDYELQGILRRTHRIEDCTILDTETLSDAVDLRGYGLVGLIVPTIDNGDLQFHVADIEGGTYRVVINDDGSAFAIATGTGNCAVSADHLAALCAYRWVKIEAQTVQTADRVLQFIVKM